MTSALSCVNCWHNPLQSGSFGTTYGYCVEHNLVLRRPDETTCSLQIRKDLLLPTAEAEQKGHSERFGPRMDLKLVGSAKAAEKEIYYTSPNGSMNGDKVVSIVREYGEYGTKIESLAQLRAMSCARAETAMLNLARGYTRRCIERGGTWTSGLHLLWWTRQHMESDPIPKISLDDLRFQMPVPIKRQQEIVQWSLIMLRLVFIADIATHAHTKRDRIAHLDSIAEDAAADTGIVSLRKLRTWVKKNAIPRFDEILGEARYMKLSKELHQPPTGCAS